MLKLTLSSISRKFSRDEFHSPGQSKVKPGLSFFYESMKYRSMAGFGDQWISEWNVPKQSKQEIQKKAEEMKKVKAGRPTKRFKKETHEAVERWKRVNRQFD